MWKKMIVLLFCCILTIAVFNACDSGSSGGSDSGDDQLENTDDGDSGSDESNDDTSDDSTENSDTHEDEDDYDVDESGAVTITLNGTSISVSGSGATVSGSVVTITSAGTYNISGTLNDGQIIVETDDEDSVKLVLDDADISCSTNAPLAIMQAEKTIITLADGSENSLTDSDDYEFPDADTDEPNAALYSKDDLTITGNGTLEVNGNYNDGITSKDGLIIAGGKITVSSVDDGIRGKDYLVIEGGTITVEADGDGLKSDNDEDTEKGYIQVEDGTIDIESGGDALTAETDVIITGGTFSLTTAGGHNKSISSDLSAKGIKAGVLVKISGGTFTIDSAEDAVHSNTDTIVSGGEFSIASADDAFHSDSSLTVNDGDILISTCYEGLEGTTITINGGTMDITADDDGINISGGNDGSGMVQRPGDENYTSGSSILYINGGYIVVDAIGDGLDSNGSIEMNDGKVIVVGPTSSANSAIDYDGSFNMNGGFLIAAGSSGMAQAPGTGSDQYSVGVTFSSTISAGALFHIETSGGTDLVTFSPSRRYQSVVFSSPDLASGTSYKVYYNGSSTGSFSDFLYTGGSYSPGTLYSTFTVSSKITQVGGTGGSSGGFR